MGLLQNLEFLKKFKCKEDKCVLSVYLNTDRSAKNIQQGEWKIRLKNGLKRLEEYLIASGETDELKHYQKVKKKVYNEIVGSQSKFRKSVVVFASEKQKLWSVYYLHLPVKNSFHWEKEPVLDQLIQLQKSYPKSGIVMPHLDEIRIYDTVLGEIEGMNIFEFDPNTENWRRKKGVASSDRAAATALHVDHHRQRLMENLNRFYKEAAVNIDRLAKEKKWEQVYLIGEKELVQNLQSNLKTKVTKIIPKNLKNTNDQAVLTAVFNE